MTGVGNRRPLPQQQNEPVCAPPPRVNFIHSSNVTRALSITVLLFKTSQACSQMSAPLSTTRPISSWPRRAAGQQRLRPHNFYGPISDVCSQSLADDCHGDEEKALPPRPSQVHPSDGSPRGANPAPFREYWPTLYGQWHNKNKKSKGGTNNRVNDTHGQQHGQIRGPSPAWPQHGAWCTSASRHLCHPTIRQLPRRYARHL